MGQPGAPIRDQTILLRLSGLLNGGLDAATDAPATIVERRYGRPLLAGFHGAWSVAGLLAAGLGSALTGRGVPVVPHVLAVALVLHYYSSRLERVFVPGVPESRLSMGLLLTDVANLVGLDAALLKAVAWHESSWRMVEGPSGEIGVMQVMPSMAQWVQRALISYPLDPHERATNILEGTLLNPGGDAAALLSGSHWGQHAQDASAIPLRQHAG